MNRSEIRYLLRSLIDQPEEAPKGSFLNAELNIYINIAQRQVLLDLAGRCPNRFNKWKKISTTAAKGEYSLETDFSLTDVLLIRDIIRNKSGERPIPLLYCLPEHQWTVVSVSDTGDPKVWGRGEEGSIFLRPIPAEAYADRYLMIYVEKIPDLNDDSTDDATHHATPHLDEIAHPLIAYKAAELCKLKDEEIGTDVETQYANLLALVAKQVGPAEGMPLLGITPSVSEILAALGEDWD